MHFQRVDIFCIVILDIAEHPHVEMLYIGWKIRHRSRTHHVHVGHLNELGQQRFLTGDITTWTNEHERPVGMAPRKFDEQRKIHLYLDHPGVSDARVWNITHVSRFRSWLCILSVIHAIWNEQGMRIEVPLLLEKCRRMNHNLIGSPDNSLF